MNRAPFPIALVVSLFATAPLPGQQPAPPAVEYREEIEVRAIDIDVVVTDRRGNPITDLSREDFELYENGKLVEIDYFSRITDGEIADLPAPVAELAAAEKARIPLTWVIFIDHTNLLPQLRNASMRHLQSFLETTLRRGDRGMVAVNDGRAFKIRQIPTDDQRLVLQTLAKISRERIPPNPTRNQRSLLLGHMRRSELEWGAVPSPGQLQARDEEGFMSQTAGGEIQILIRQEATRTKSAILALGTLLEGLARVEGRLALVYVGAGFNSLPGADLAASYRSSYPQFAEAPWAPRPEEESFSIERDIVRLYENMSALRVTFYSIHGGEQPGAPVSVEDRGQVDPRYEQTSDIGAITEVSFAREMAERTGGLYFRVNPALSRQLDRMANDFQNYYALGYTPRGPQGDLRDIRVKVVGMEGARVRHRRTVRERTPGERAAGAVTASMARPTRVPQPVRRAQTAAVPESIASAANPLGVSVAASRPRSFGGGPGVLPFDFTIRLEELTFERRDDAHHAAFAMHFTLVTRDGAMYPLDIREQRLSVPVAELEAGADRQPGVDHQVSVSWHIDMSPLRIPPGVPVRDRGAQLSVTVEDRLGPKRSVVTVPLGDS